MLNLFRQKSGQLAAKIILGVLVLSFAAWGIADYVNRSSNPYLQTVASVGDHEISGAQLVDQTNNYLKNINRGGQNISFEQAAQLGLVDRVLSDLTRELLIKQELRSLGLSLSNSRTLELVKDIGFFVENDQFSEDRFKDYLNRSGQTEQQFVQFLKQDIIQKQLFNSLYQNISAPATRLKASVSFTAQEREITGVYIPYDKFTNIGDPTEEDILKTYEARKESYKNPEYRAYSYITLNPQKFVDEYPTLSDDELKSYFDDHQDSLMTPEKRSFTQAVFPSEEAATKVYEQAKDNPEILKSHNPQNFTDMTREMLLEPIAQAVFEADEGQIISPFSTDFGWYVIAVQKITASRLPPFEEVKKTLQSQLHQERALEAFYAKVQNIEEAVAAKTPLKDVAKNYGLKVTEVQPTNLAGDRISGANVEPDDILRRVFDLNSAGEATAFFESPSGEMILAEVNQIIESKPRDLENVRASIIKEWREAERSKRALDLADKIQKELRSPDKVQDMAQTYGLKAIAKTSFTRKEAEKIEDPLSPEILQAVFQTPKGNTLSQESGRGRVVLMVSDVRTPTLADAAADEQAAREGGYIYSQELLEYTLKALEEKHPIRIYDGVLNSVIALQSQPLQ